MPLSVDLNSRNLTYAETSTTDNVKDWQCSLVEKGNTIWLKKQVAIHAHASAALPNGFNIL
jgi:hypothetical protein